jgi:hypothetical protein
MRGQVVNLSEPGDFDMRFFFSGELDVDIADFYRPTRQRIEKKLNEMCSTRDYGDAIVKIAIIPMILRPVFLAGRKERRLFQRKQREADYRMIIDFERFRDGDDAVREKLLLKNVIDAITDLARKAGKSFAGQLLIDDILNDFGLDQEDLDS